jgi:hypothetical protein
VNQNAEKHYDLWIFPFSFSKFLKQNKKRQTLKLFASPPQKCGLNRRKKGNAGMIYQLKFLINPLRYSGREAWAWREREREVGVGVGAAEEL